MICFVPLGSLHQNFLLKDGESRRLDVALRDVCRLSPEEARETARWTIRAIVQSALSEAKSSQEVAEAGS